MEQEDDEFNFTYLKSKLSKSVLLPSQTWGYTKGNHTFFGLQKMESDFTVRKRVAVLPNMHVEIYVDNEIIPLTQFIILVNMDQFISLLKSVDELSLPNH